MTIFYWVDTVKTKVRKKALDIIELLPQIGVASFQDIFVVLRTKVIIERGEHVCPCLLVESVANPVPSLQMLQHEINEIAFQQWSPMRP